MKNPKFTHAFEVVADLPAPIATLQTLAHNFRWSWDHATRDLFRSIDKTAWANSYHNPVAFLNSVKSERLLYLAEDEAFLERLRDVTADLDRYLTSPTWFDETYPGRRDSSSIAYFCFEFGITEGLPIYSGGLGVLAGDHLKAASDLGLPLVGVGLLYNRGYFRQRLTHDGWQQEIYPQYDFYEMPLSLVREADGQPVRIEVEFPDRNVTLQVWRAQVGRVDLYLLDSNILENADADQGITDSLYSGDEDMRIRQEMILGIGGMKALRAMNIRPTVCHMNEGHAAFLSLERIRQFMADHGCDFRTARKVVVNGNAFTTHTPVPAGFDLFRPDQLERYLGRTIADAGIGFNEFLRLGRVHADNPNEKFNMALLAMETANHVNGVSQLHGAVSRGLFSERWRDYPEDEVPITGITNGIHTMTWISRRMASVLDAYVGDAWRRAPQDPANWAAVDDIPDEELWYAREASRADLVRFVRKRLQLKNLAGAGFQEDVLDSRALTLGFARRFATYKRGSLMLRDRERLRSLLFHAERPVQIIISGKSHPKDDGGKHIIQDLWNFIHKEGARARMVFLEDYDMQTARALIQGVDVWLNNPRRPYEASGTSGMKVVPNGGLNCSILDGWWDEAYQPGLGWAIGDRTNADDTEQQDWLDSRSLYHLLEAEIGPLFYRRDPNGVPTDWVRMIKNSMRVLAPFFSTGRMVKQYADDVYMPASAAYCSLATGDLAVAQEAIQWRDRVQAAWSKVRIVRTEDTAGASRVVRSDFAVRAWVELGDLKPEDVSVQVVIGKVGPNRELLNTRVEDLTWAAAEGTIHRYEGRVRSDILGHQGFTVRVVPTHPNVSVPSELELVSWANT